jgi:hypothetical protein
MELCRDPERALPAFEDVLPPRHAVEEVYPDARILFPISRGHGILATAFSISHKSVPQILFIA